MGRDYYEILGVPRTATESQIREGYKWSAVKWHPEKNPNGQVEAEERFRDVAEAYDVLLDPLRRHRFDRVGERGLKFPEPGSGQPYQYVGNPYQLFIDVFADANPFAFAYDMELEGHAPSLFPKRPEEAIEVELLCSLAEIQDGATRRISVERQRLGPGGEQYTESKLVTVPVRRGWKAGMRVTYRGEGNHTDHGRLPGDLVVVIGLLPPESAKDPRAAVAAAVDVVHSRAAA